MVSLLRRQICLNPVWWVGSEGSRSGPERPEAERSEAAGPEPTQPNWIQTNSDKQAARPKRWLVRIMTSLNSPPPPPPPTAPPPWTTP
ncbi:MAG: hypothetical protein GY696_17450, partial [Gammaproteobacteria bacterium]|nr:hypothetical protein [Gammaproteobacteria bacterium]